MSIRLSDDRLLHIVDFYAAELDRLSSDPEARLSTCLQFGLRAHTLTRYLQLAGHGNHLPVTEDELRAELDKKLSRKALSADAAAWERQARFWKEMAESQASIRDNLAGLVPHLPAVIPPDLPQSPAYGQALALTQWSDWHVFRTVSLAETEGMYEYNFEIFCKLFWDLLQKTVDITTIQRGAHAIPALWIVFGGDILNDEHRTENIKSNELYNSLGVFKLACVAVQGLRYLLKHYERLDIDCVVGNEPRILKDKTAKHQWNNWDFVFYNILQVALTEEIRRGRVRMFVPLSPDIVVEQMGYRWLITHGDKAKSWNGIPYYGINRYIMKQHDLRRPHRAFNPHGLDFDYTLMHDKHTSSSLNHDTVFINGALTGTDEYAKNVLSVGGPRMQRLMFVNDSYGPFCQYPLFPLPHAEHPFEIPEHTAFPSSLVAEVAS